MSVNVGNIMCVSSGSPSWFSILEDYIEVFMGEEKLEEKLHLALDETVPPVILPVRKIPLAAKDPLKRETDRLVNQEIPQASRYSDRPDKGQRLVALESERERK